MFNFKTIAETNCGSYMMLIQINDHYTTGERVRQVTVLTAQVPHTQINRYQSTLITYKSVNI